MLDRENGRGRERQIEFPPEQSPHRLVTPVMLGVSILFVIIVAIVVSTDGNGPFLGPWG
jgi:UDP-N-acetylmuramyl pentapeptide phosphotransferase/UDP-N-acetylglucosamine-1-phosphate transferase